MDSTSIESDNLNGEKFFGFDDFTNAEIQVDLNHRRKIVNNIIKNDHNESMDLDESSDNLHIVNSNHVKRKNQSKSNISSPEINDVKHNRNANKRIKKDIKAKSTDSMEPNVQLSLELTTPTFNLTSTPKSRRSVGRKINVDITNPAFKLPFEYGWKRELVYRTSGDSSINNKTNRSGDVYYYSPNNRKLRSLREIQEQLDLSLIGNDLTIDCFTFLKQPIGMNDRSKELIRDANVKLSKEDSFAGVSIKSKKAKTPVRKPFDYELSENENNKSSNKMKIVFKNVKKSKSKKNKSKESMNTSSTPEYITEDWQAIQSSVVSKSDSEINNSTNNKRRLSTSDGEVIMQAPCGIRCPNSDEPATLMCAQCLVYYHPACVNLNANLKIVGYVCINCRSSMRQRNRRTQSSHTVVVGVSEPEQQRVEPIRIRQVHQASVAPNFFIDNTPISKTEEPNYESDENSEESISVINTVVCQGNVCRTAMVPGYFHEQYVYEMKQTRGPSLMTCVVQEPKNLDESFEMNGSLKENSDHLTNMQSLSYMIKSLRHVFTYLKVHELLSASRVCSAWNMVAMDHSLWQNVRLKNATICDWEKLVTAINKKSSVSLDTRRMLIPSKIEEYEQFWKKFDSAIKRASQLKVLELYRCPAHVLETTIQSLPQIEKLNASTMKNPNVTKVAKNSNDFIILNLSNLSQVINLTELRLKGLCGIKIISLPSFEELANLKVLSLTSIKSFPKDIYSCLNTVSTNLEFLEIGDCDYLTKQFPVVLKKFVNLTSLRLESCCGKFQEYAQELFVTIRGLEKLKVLELINIEFSFSVEEELEKCLGIKALLIIPAYVSQSATTNCHLIDCLKKLSNTLTHFVWGITHELLRVTDLFITQYQQDQLTIGYNLDISNTKETSNNIPILRSRKPRQNPGEEPDKNDSLRDKSDNVDILSVPALEKLLDSMMLDAKTKVIKIPFSATTRVYLAEHFNDL